MGATDRPVWRRTKGAPWVTFRSLLLLPLVVGVLALPAPASAATLTPNLVVTAVSELPSGVAEGAAFTVHDTTRNIGKHGASATVTRYYLTLNPKRSLDDRETSKANPRTSLTDVLLVGTRKVPTLAVGATSKTPTAGVVVRIPVGVGPGDYFLLACADDLGTVKESAEAPNCKASTQKRAVQQANPTSRVDAYSDTKRDVDPSVLPLVPQLLQGLACGGAIPTHALSLGQAIASARAFLSATAGANAMSAFAASHAFDSANAAQEAAGEAALKGFPGAALAALLRAHDLEPAEASHLVNAAGVAASIGLPNEALAFLDAAAKLSPGVRAPMGISRQAIALTTRGYALMQLGRNGEARSALTAAIAREPLLTEAQATLAGVNACLNQNPLPAFKKGRRRVDPPPELDDTQGKVTELRNLPLPATALNAYGEASFYQGLMDDVAGDLTDLSNRDAQIEALLNAQNRNLITQRRALEIRQLVVEVQQQPDLAALDAQITSELAAAQASYGPLFGAGSDPGDFQDFVADAVVACEESPDPNCEILLIREKCIPATNLTHSGWTNEMNAALEHSRLWQRMYSRRASAMATHFGNPLEYELAENLIRFHGDHRFQALANQAHLWSATLEFFTDHDTNTPLCVTSPDPPAFVPPSPVAPKGAGPCSDGVKDFSLSFSLGPVSLSGNCEQVSVSGAGEGWLSGFGEVGYNFREGTMTVFAGAKAEVGLGPASADFKSGVYVKVGNDGVRDVGWRVGPSYKVGAGPAEFGRSDTTDLSFVGAFGSTAI